MAGKKYYYLAAIRFPVAFGIYGPLPVRTDGVLKSETCGKDDGSILVIRIREPTEFAVVDEHRNWKGKMLWTQLKACSG